MVISVGIVGLGRWGDIRRRVYMENPDVTLSCVYDIEPSRRDLVESYGCRFYTDLEEMLKIEKLDLVNVSAPASRHEEISYKCLEAGSNVLVEKPMATTLEGATRLRDMAKESGLVLTVGYTERFNPSTLEMRELFLNGYIGNLISMNSKKRAASVYRVRDVGVVLDIAIHDIYKMINFHKKNPVEVYAVARRVMRGKHEDFANIMLSFEDGVVGHIEADRTRSTREHEFELNGTRGSCKENRSDPNWKNHFLEYSGGFVEDVDGLDFKGLEEYFGKFSPEKVEKRLMKPKTSIEPAKLEINELVSALINKKLPPVSLEEAFQSTKMALLSLVSSEKHSPISIEK